jgi:hypothetical protein
MDVDEAAVLPRAYDPAKIVDRECVIRKSHRGADIGG